MIIYQPTTAEIAQLASDDPLVNRCIKSSVQAHRLADPVAGSGYFLVKAIRAASEIGHTPVGPVACPVSHAVARRCQVARTEAC